MRKVCLALLIMFCGLAAPANGRVVDLFDYKRLFKSVDEEFGRMRGSYFVPNRSVSEQVSMGKSHGTPDIRSVNGYYLASGCRYQSCDEKSAVLVTPAGTMAAAAMIYFPCAMLGPKDPQPTGYDCLLDPDLALFVKQENNKSATLQILRDWAEDVMAADRKQYGEKHVGHIHKTDVRIIP